MRILYRLILIAISVNVTGLLYAIEPKAPPGLEAVPDVPPPLARVQSGETLEPEVTIVQRRDAKIYPAKLHRSWQYPNLLSECKWRQRGVNNVNISQTSCEKSHSNRNACSVYLDTVLSHMKNTVKMEVAEDF
jgi:hypothetical protein